MAVERIRRPEFPTEPDAAMIKELIAEIRRPAKASKPAGAPVVIAQEGDVAPNVHYYVVWDRFGEVNDDVRTKIVSEAVKKACPKDFPGLITAMGLTTMEAKALQIPGLQGT